MLANHVLISSFELGSKLSTVKLSLPKHLVVTSFVFFFLVLSHKIVTTKIVMTETCHQCFGSDKREYIILIFWGHKQNFSTVMQFIYLFFLFFCILVCKLKFCNVMWLAQKHYCHFRKCAVTTEAWDVLSKIKYTKLPTKML